MAYAVRAVLGSVANTTTGTHTVTATPSVNDLIVIVCANTGRVTNPTVTDNNSGGGGTYTQYQSALARASADKMFLYVRTGALISSATSTIFSVTGASSTGGAMIVLAITGITTFYKAVRNLQIGNQNNAAIGTPQPAFPAVALTQDVIIGAVLNATSPAGLTQRGAPAYSEGCDLGFASPTTGFEEMHIATGETAQTITWGGGSASAFGALVVELNNNYLLQTTTRAFSETGSNAYLLRSRKTLTAAGSYTETGSNALLSRGYPLKTTIGAITEAGQNAYLLFKRQIRITTGGFAEAGSNALLLEGHKTLAAPGGFAVAGQNAMLLFKRQIWAVTNNFIETGNNSYLLRGRMVLVEIGGFTESASNALLRIDHKVFTTPGGFTLVGNDVILTYTKCSVGYILTTDSGEFILTSNRVTLIYMPTPIPRFVYTMIRFMVHKNNFRYRK